MKILKILGVVFLLLTNCKCIFFDRNTSDPQASTSIQGSKKDSLFLEQYVMDSMYNSEFKIKDAWIEYSWKNEYNLFRLQKVKLDEFQLNISINKLRDDLDSSEYFSSWKMLDNSDESFATANGMFVLFLKNKVLPDKFEIKIYKIDNNRNPTYIGKFRLRKSNVLKR